MSLIVLIVILLFVGVVLYYVNKAPLVGWIKTLINVVCIIVVILLLLQQFGVWDEIKSVKVPHL